MESRRNKEDEAKRLSDLGIPYRQLMMLDDGIVVIVDDDVLNRIIEIRESGNLFEGRFISLSDGLWSGSYIDEFGDHHYRRGLTERLVYRFVLNYEIGRRPQTSRFKGYDPIYRIKQD